MLMITAAEYAKLHGFCKTTVIRAARTGRLKTAKEVNGRWLIESSERLEREKPGRKAEAPEEKPPQFKGITKVTILPPSSDTGAPKKRKRKGRPENDLRQDVAEAARLGLSYGQYKSRKALEALRKK